MRTNMTARGAVTSFFTYSQAAGTGYAHEIDYEFLTNQINGKATNHQVLATSWKDWGAPGSNYNDGTHHQSANPAVAGLDLTQFNTFKIRWLPARTEWVVNGVTVASWAEAHPTVAAPVRFNFWPPDSSWADAYDAGLTPATTAAADRLFTYDIDYVQVSTVPVPEPAFILTGAAALAALAAGRRGKWTLRGSNLRPFPCKGSALPLS